MKKIVFVSNDENRLKPASKAFKADYEISFADSGGKTLEMVKNNFVTLVVIDEKLADFTGIELAEEIIKINAMTNTAISSSLSDHDFHEASEGLGVLMKLPIDSTEENGRELEAYLSKIINPR